MSEKFIPLHYVEINNFEKIAKNNGFICPSIAYTQDPTANFNYGNIGIIFDEELIDPEKNPNAYLFSGDGFTGVVNINSGDATIEELVNQIREQSLNNEAFLYATGINICKAACAQKITLEQAKQEVGRLVSFDEYREYKEKYADKYYEFLDANFPKWEYSDKQKKYLLYSPYCEQNCIAQNVEVCFKFVLQAAAQSNFDKKAVMAEAKKVGLKLSSKKADNVISFAQELRNAPIRYMEAKVFDFVPLDKVKGIVMEWSLPFNELPEIVKETFSNLERKGIPIKLCDSREQQYELIKEINANTHNITQEVQLSPQQQERHHTPYQQRMMDKINREVNQKQHDVDIDR